MRECTVPGCPHPAYTRGRCKAHYDAARKAGLHPDCRCGADGVGWCDTHWPPVCVCADPDVPTDGVCRRCQRLHTPANPDLQALAAEVREAWRTWLTDEGVLEHVEAARHRALEATS